ncbi:universal stress protein [Myxococcota bacterium]|nr:universal stress protein [Myxococcota bacterium]
MFRRVVAGTDFSRAADHALALAIELARATGAGLTLVHVCEPDDDDLARFDDALARALTRHRCTRVEITTVVRSGRPWSKLDNVAAEVGASLIVVGRHGAGRGPRVALGSVAEALVRSASRPVLTVANDLERLDLEALPPHRH